MNNSCILSLCYWVVIEMYEAFSPYVELLWSWRKLKLIGKGKFKEMFSYLTRINQAWLHHTQAARESVSQKVLNATECLRGARKLKRERAHRRRIALCNCVKKLLLLLLCVVAELFLLLLAATMAELMRADPLPDHLKWIMMRWFTQLSLLDSSFFLLFTWLCITIL